jgi:hypothetical protein
LEGNIVGFLNRWAVCDGIGKGKTKLNDVWDFVNYQANQLKKGSNCTSASSLHAEHDIWGLVCGGVASSDIGHEGSSLLFLALCESRFDLLHTGRTGKVQGLW